jgi:hypothetical protein
MGEVTRIPSAVEQWDPRAAEQLLPLGFDEPRKVVAARLASEAPGQTLQPAALVHEARRGWRYWLCLPGTMAAPTTVALTVIRVAYFRLHGPDADPYGANEHFAIDPFGMAAYLAAAAAVVRAWRRSVDGTHRAVSWPLFACRGCGVASVRAEIVRYTDDRQTGMVECRLTDASGRVWSFGEKVPVVTDEYLDADSQYPCFGSIACTVLGRDEAGVRVGVAPLSGYFECVVPAVVE